VFFRNQNVSDSFSHIDGEEHLVRSAISGEASAFGSLYDFYEPKIYRFILFKVSHREEAEDLTHHVFLKAWQSMPNFKERGGVPFSSWLYRIARNQVIDHYRTKRDHADLEQVDREFTPSMAVAHINSIAVDQNLEMEKIWTAVQKLEPEHQDVIVMRFIDELSVRETAKAMEKSEGAVKVLQHRALQKLKNILSEKV